MTFSGRYSGYFTINLIEKPIICYCSEYVDHQPKLASGLSATHRMRDLADVQDLMIAVNLPLELKDELDKSVRPKYQRIWEAANKGPHR
jgi:hypothetical protein